MSNPRVWVIDTSALIRIKQTVAAKKQWELFKKLEAMVEDGLLYFPRQVTSELNQERHIDTPEAWSLAAGPKVQRCYDPDPDIVEHVMAEAGDVIDADAEEDSGDPYVLAQALELIQQNFAVCIVTEDVKDHLPLRISIATACNRLDLEYCQLTAFLAAI